MILIILLIVLSIFRIFSPNFSIGLEGGAHIGSLKGAFELEAFDDENVRYVENFADDASDDASDDADEVEQFAGDDDDDSDEIEQFTGDDSDEVEDFANQGQNGDLVLFFAEWCGHCKKLMPHFNKLMQNYNGNVRIVKIDSDENPQLINSHNVRGFPTIRYFPEGMDKINNFKEYNGERDYSGLLNYLSNM